MTQTSNVERKVPTRRISFEESLEELPRHFAADGDLVMSHAIAVLSGVFPDGEDFFVRSVRHFRSEITDPELKRQVGGFIGQEAIHGREHRAFNDRLDQLGYPTKRVERVIKSALTTRERFMSPKSNLAETAALEHFTATFAELVLGDEEVRSVLGRPEVTDLLLWHALEESEHKAVAFDVYKAVGGKERMRTMTMNVVLFGLITSVVIMVILSMLGDRSTYRPLTLIRSVRRLRHSPFLRPDVWHQLRDYNRADFHPDDRDSTEQVEKWRNELFGENGRLNHMVTTASPAAA